MPRNYAVKKYWFGLCLVGVFTGTFAFIGGRATAQGDWTGDYYFARGQKFDANQSGAQKEKYLGLLQAAIGNKDRMRLIAQMSATRDNVDLGEVYAVEMMQNQRIIEQNARLIALLEKRK